MRMRPPDDIARMAAVVRDGLRAGALGFSTSRTEIHRAKTKEFVPGTFAPVDELMGMGRAMGEAGHGVFEVVSDLAGPDASLDWMFKLSAETGRPSHCWGRCATTSIDQFVDFMKQHKIDGARVMTSGRRALRGAIAESAKLTASVHHASDLPQLRPSSLEERVAKMRDPKSARSCCARDQRSGKK